MELNLTNLVPDQIIKALCNTLIHSLWQGLILAVITGITIVLTKKSGAALRYNLMLGFLLLFAAATVSTFLVELTPPANNIAAKQALNKPAQQLQVLNNQPVYTDKPGNVIATGIGYFTSHADAIVLIWFLIICARCVQFAAGLQHVYYLRRNKTLTAGVYWERKINGLANSMGIKTTVSVMQSGIAKIPMVLGHFKPVILIPIGLLTALSAEEVESILIHELAHIRRKDFLVNLLQNLMEIIFFFNPAVLWVSALIKTERENCCDDIVVAQTSSKVSYIKALVSCEEYHSSMPAYAMGLGGKNGHFLNRVKRMLSNNNQSLNRMEKAVLTICLVSAIIVTAAFTKPNTEKPVSKVKNSSVSNIKISKKVDSLSRTFINTNDTITANVLKIYKTDEVSDGTFLRFDKSVNHKKYLIYLAKKDGILYQYNSSYDGKMSSYYVNGVLLTADKLPQYQAKLDDVFNQDLPEPAAPPAPGAIIQNDGQKGEIVDDADSRPRVVPDRESYEDDHRRDSLKRRSIHGKIAPDSLKKMHAMGKPGKLSTMKFSYNLDSAKSKRFYSSNYSAYSKTYKTDSVKYHQTYSYKYHITPPTAPAMPKAPKMVPGPPVPVVATPAMPATAATPAMPAMPARPAGPATPVAPLPDMGDELTHDLISSKLIKNPDKYTFKITNNSLYIDGVKQPDDVFNKIAAKYIKPGDKIEYTHTKTVDK